MTTRMLALPYSVAGLVAMLSYTIAFSQQIPKYNSNSAASATVYLDLDGQNVRNTAWNWDEVIRAKPAGLSTAIITEIFNRVAEDFRIFNLNITTDSTVFKKAPTQKRMRVIITPSSEWYGNSAGVSFVNSFTWGDDTPAWVFTKLLENKAKYIAEAASHEIGHTLGLQHQSTYSKNCELLAEYAEGKGAGEIGWAPIMGVGYYKNVTGWMTGTSIEGCKVVQNDINTLVNGFANIGLRKDDHGNNKENATNLILTNNNFHSAGIINSSSDRDFFKVVLNRRMQLKATIIPANVGENNAGSNVDLYLTLIKSTGDTIGRYNPKSMLNASVDTALAAGTYYFAADGVGNQNLSDYGSVGLYSLAGSLQNLVAAPTVLLRGNIRDNMHIIRWQLEPGIAVRAGYVEYSLDGTNYSTLNSVPRDALIFERIASRYEVFYRVKMVTDEDSTIYSNTVVLGQENNNRMSVNSSIVHSEVRVNSPGEYWYQLIDATGRLLGHGKLSEGSNIVPLNVYHTGVILLKAFNNSAQFQFRLIKQ